MNTRNGFALFIVILVSLAISSIRADVFMAPNINQFYVEDSTKEEFEKIIDQNLGILLRGYDLYEIAEDRKIEADPLGAQAYDYYYEQKFVVRSKSINQGKLEGKMITIFTVDTDNDSSCLDQYKLSFLSFEIN